MENSENTTPDLTPEPADTSVLPAQEAALDASDPRADAPADPLDGTADPQEDTPAEPQDEAEPQAGPDRRKVALLGAGLLVAILIGVIVWFAVSTSAVARENAIKGTATAYLTALADADADGALNQLAERPANATLLTRDVLEASQRTTPLTDVEVTAVDQNDNEATANATYRLGDEQVSTQLRLVGDGRTSWRIAGGTAVLSVPETRGLNVNGAALTEAANPVFPGTYTAAPLSNYLRLDGETTAFIANPAQEGAQIAVTPTLSDAGHDAVLTAVKTRFDECLAATVSRPADCPFGVATDGVDIAPDSVRWTLTNDPWTGFAPTVDPSSLIAGGTFHFELTGTATVTINGLTGEVSQPFAYDRAFEVDLTQSPAVVVWR